MWCQRGSNQQLCCNLMQISEQILLFVFRFKGTTEKTPTKLTFPVCVAVTPALHHRKPFQWTVVPSLHATTHIIKSHYRQTKSVNSGGAAASSWAFSKCSLNANLWAPSRPSPTTHFQPNHRPFPHSRFWFFTHLACAAHCACLKFSRKMLQHRDGCFWPRKQLPDQQKQAGKRTKRRGADSRGENQKIDGTRLRKNDLEKYWWRSMELFLQKFRVNIFPKSRCGATWEKHLWEQCYFKKKNQKTQERIWNEMQENPRETTLQSALGNAVLWLLFPKKKKKKESTWK